MKERSEQDDLIDDRDKLYKERMQRVGSNIKEHNFIVGDFVLAKQRKRNKWSTYYEPVFYAIIKISGLQLQQGKSQMAENQSRFESV